MYIMVRDNGEIMEDFCKNLSYEKSRKGAFTLAEVLITLGIIGVVAVLTIVPLVKNYQEKALVNRLKETYSMLTKAYELAKVDNGTIDTWNIGNLNSTDGATKVYNYFKPYLKVSKDCGTSTNKNCFANHYKALFNDSLYFQTNQLNHHYKVVLQNGVALSFQSFGSSAGVYVDVNGKKLPNRGGVDFYIFNINLAKNVSPYDAILNPNEWHMCKYNDKSDKNYACTAWAIEMGNMDYLRRDVTDDWKKHKGIK